MSSRQYITTAIDYPNAPPHMGHVLEKVLADVAARWFRLRGDEVRFQIGTDEHGIKIQQTADKEKLSPKELVDRNVPLFQDLYKRLGISADLFIRTSDQHAHWPTVVELWKRLEKAKMLEKRTYTGLYCSGCERFLTSKDLVDGECAIHHRAPEKVEEENYFFLLSKETECLTALLRNDYKIIPQYRENETVALLEHGLEDVSFSRPVTSLSWGVPVPNDDKQTMYVWCDALTNYISGLGYFTDHEDTKWWNDATVTHVIGKDIARFHALIWPAMLKHAGVKTPDKLLIHGFLTSEGEKMSKSLGNVVKPDDVLAHFSGSPDPLRFYLSHEVPVGQDGDFSWKRIDEVYDSKLRNLGNLLNRILVMMKKVNVAIELDQEPTFLSNQDCWVRYSLHMKDFDFWSAAQYLTQWVSACDKYMNDQAPWKKDASESKRIAVLSILAENVRHISLMLLPFTPETAQKISMQLGVPYAATMIQKDFFITDEMKQWGGMKDWKTVGEPSILFPPLEKKSDIAA